MKPIFLAAALATLCTPAAAADLATKYPVKALSAPVFSWTGFYLGANAGFGGNSFSSDNLLYSATSLTTLTAFDGAANASVNSSGFIAGGQVGYNYQFSNRIVVGLETDLQWSGIEGRAKANVYNSGVLTDAANVGGSLDYFGTIRARLGYAFDRFMPYVTGGAAYGRSKISDTSYSTTGGLFQFTDAATNWGWTIGLGAEMALTSNWMVKAEYLYVDLGSLDYAFYDSAAGTATFGTMDNTFHTLKAGVNYRF